MPRNLMPCTAALPAITDLLGLRESAGLWTQYALPFNKVKLLRRNKRIRDSSYLFVNDRFRSVSNSAWKAHASQWFWGKKKRILAVTLCPFVCLFVCLYLYTLICFLIIHVPTNEERSLMQSTIIKLCASDINPIIQFISQIFDSLFIRMNSLNSHLMHAMLVSRARDCVCVFVCE